MHLVVQMRLEIKIIFHALPQNSQNNSELHQITKKCISVTSHYWKIVFYFMDDVAKMVTWCIHQEFFIQLTRNVYKINWPYHIHKGGKLQCQVLENHLQPNFWLKFLFNVDEILLAKNICKNISEALEWLEMASIVFNGMDK